MIRRRLTLALALAVLAAACSDHGPTQPRDLQPGGAARSQQPSAATLDDRITALGDSVFPKGLGNAFTARWTNVKRQLARDAGNPPHGPAAAARQMFVELAEWTQSNAGAMTPPIGETAAHVAARLVLYMGLYVYQGPSAQPPGITGATDAVLAIVQPNAPATIQTPTLHAGVSFPAGAVAEPTTVVITQETTPYPTNCSGPLDTRLCQYPQFYKFNVFPDVKLQKPVGVAVCHVNAGDHRTPLADHDRFRLAHDTPADPAAYSPGSTIVDGIEILPLTFFTGLIDCGTNDTYSAAFSRLPRRGGLFGHAVDRVLEVAAAAADRVTSALTPKAAYAIDQGGGGFVLEFSTFAVIDPQSQPDIAMQRGFGVASEYAAPNGSVTINPFTIQNVGTATSPGYTSSLVIATTPDLKTGAMLLAPPTHHSALAPGQLDAEAAQSLTVPAILPYGVYYVGAQLAQDAAALPELTTANNTASALVAVTAPLGSNLPCSAEGSIRSLVGDQLTAINFVNNSSQTVSVYWLDYSGQRVLYNTLPPGASYVQGTYITHPWILVAADGSCDGIFMPAAQQRTVAVGVDGAYWHVWQTGAFTHVDEIHVAGTQISGHHSFTDGTTSGSWDWSGTIAFTSPSAGTISGDGTRNDSCCDPRAFKLTNGSVVLNADGSADISYGAVDQRFGAFGDSDHRPAQYRPFEGLWHGVVAGKPAIAMSGTYDANDNLTMFIVTPSTNDLSTDTFPYAGTVTNGVFTGSLPTNAGNVITLTLSPDGRSFSGSSSVTSNGRTFTFQYSASR